MDAHRLETYTSRLLGMRTRLIREVTTTEDALRQDVVAPGDATTMPTHPADQDAEGFDENIAIAQNEEFLLEHVEAALERIEGGTFGNCQTCGHKIDKKRLDAIPYTPSCINCAQ